MTERPRAAVVLLGRPRLGTWDVAAQALAVGPMASIALGGFLIAGAAGGVTPFVVSVSLIGALCLGWTVSRYARRYAGAGAVYEYIASVLGKPVGVACAGLEFFVGPLGLGTLYLAFGLLAQQFAITHFGFDPGWWSGGVIVAATTFAVQYRGIRLATRVQLVLTVLSVTPFLILVVAVIAAGGTAGNTATVFHPNATAGTDVFRSFLFAVLLFGGFEASAALGEETRLPHRSIPVAMLTTIGAAGLFYVAVVYAATIGFGAGNVATEWGGNPAGLSVLADRYVGAPLGALIELAVLVDLVAVAGAYGNQVGRGLFALARDELLPDILAVRSPYDTPLGGLAVAAGGGVAVLAATIGLDNRLAAVEALAVTVTLANMVVYLILSGAAPRVMGRSPAGWPVVAAAVALPALGLYGTLVPFPTGTAGLGVVTFALLVAITGAWVVLLRFRRSKQLDRAGGYAIRAGPSASR